MEEAKALALQTQSGTILHVEEDADDYDVYIQNKDTLYQVEVEKNTGRIDDVERGKYVNDVISVSEAKQIALGKVKGTIISVDD